MAVVYKFPVLLGCSFFLVLWLERTGLSWDFCVYACWCFQIAGFSTQYEMYAEKREPTKLTVVLFLKSQVS